MNTLIIYTTRYGCAGKAAGMLKEKLDGTVTLVKLVKQKDVSLDGYDRVILGGSIYIGQIQKELKAYAAKNLDSLMQKKVGLFICAGRPEPEILEQQLNSAFPEELLRHAAAKEFFGYEYDFAKLKLIDKTVVRKVVGLSESQFKLSHEAIGRFAEALK